MNRKSFAKAARWTVSIKPAKFPIRKVDFPMRKQNGSSLEIERFSAKKVASQEFTRRDGGHTIFKHGDLRPTIVDDLLAQMLPDLADDGFVGGLAADECGHGWCVGSSFPDWC